MVSLFGNQLIISTQRQVNRVYPRGCEVSDFVRGGAGNSCE